MSRRKQARLSRLGQLSRLSRSGLKGNNWFLFLMMLLGWVFFAGQVTVDASSAAGRRGASRPVLALLPFENLSGQFGADEQVTKGLRESLQPVFNLVSQSEVETVLTDLRLRHTGFLTREQIKKIGQQLKVKALLIGMVDTYRQEPVSQVSFFCELISTTSDNPIIWAKNFYGLGRQQVYLLNRGGYTDWSNLMTSVAEDLVQSLPNKIEDNGSEKNR